MKFRFRYGSHWNMTVTVLAADKGTAERKARAELDRRYEKADKEPPVSWTLRIESFESGAAVRTGVCTNPALFTVKDSSAPKLKQNLRWVSDADLATLKRTFPDHRLLERYDEFCILQ